MENAVLQLDLTLGLFLPETVRDERHRGHPPFGGWTLCLLMCP